MRPTSTYPFGSVVNPQPLQPPPPKSRQSPSQKSPALPAPLAIDDAAQIKIIDWTAVAWSAFEFAFCSFFGLAELGSKTGLSALLLPGSAVALFVLVQKCAGVVFDPSKGTLRFYSFAIPRELSLDEFRDANCEFAITLSPSRIVLGIFGGRSKSGKSFAEQRTYMVNLSGPFGSRQIRFYSKRWRDQFLSVLREQAPTCRITRWR